MPAHSVRYCDVSDRTVRYRYRQVGSPCPYCGTVLVGAQQNPDAPSTPASPRSEAGGDDSTISGAYRAEGSLAPEGWVGDRADLDRARRYRKTARMTIHVSWFAVVGYLVAALNTSFSLLPVFGVLLILNGVRVFFERKVSGLIGRKWTVSLEMKEKRLELREKRSR